MGSWGGAKAGLDAAVWTFADRVWTRQDSAGTALESTATLLVGPRGATGDGDGLLVTGSALHLDQGVDQTAAVWRSSGVSAGWHRIDLPGAGSHSEAVSAQCSAADGACLVTGQVDGRLALWDLRGDTATAQAGLPAIGVGDQDVIPRPMWAGPHSLVVSPAAGQSVVLSNAAEGWALSARTDRAARRGRSGRRPPLRRDATDRRCRSEPLRRPVAGVADGQAAGTSAGRPKVSNRLRSK